MRELLNKWPFHVLFFVLYFIFFLYTKNETHLPFNVVYKPIIYGVLFVSVEFLVVNIVLRDKLKAGLIVTAINIPILNYGIIYDVLEKLYVKGYWPLVNIHRYLLIAIAIYFVFVYLWQRKERNGNDKIT